MKTYKYEVWNGKQILSYFESKIVIAGDSFLIFKGLKIPIGTRIMKNDGIDVIVRFVLDVSQMKEDELDLLLRKL